MRIWHSIIYTLSFFPVAFSLSLLTFFFHAWSILGEPPGYNQPDPKELSIFTDYDDVIGCFLGLAFFGFFISLIVIPVYLIANRHTIQWRPVIICGIAYLSGITVFCSELLEWWLD